MITIIIAAYALLFQPISAFVCHDARFAGRHYSKIAISEFSSRLQDTLNNDIETSSTTIRISPNVVDFNSLMVMDVVLFRRKSNDATTNTKLEMGAVQENGNVAPLSTWTLESAYTSATNDMMEFVVDEEDLFPGLSSNEIDVLKVFDGDDMSYGSRQVGGGKGPGNPHGEESELLYYLDRGVVEGIYCYEGTDGEDNDEVTELSIDVVVNPDLEHLW